MVLDDDVMMMKALCTKETFNGKKQARKVVFLEINNRLNRGWMHSMRMNWRLCLFAWERKTMCDGFEETSNRKWYICRLNCLISCVVLAGQLSEKWMQFSEKHCKNCESCPTQITWKFKFKVQICLSCLSWLSWFSCLCWCQWVRYVGIELLGQLKRKYLIILS